MPGYFKPFHFITMFEYVYERAYERVDFQAFLRKNWLASRPEADSLTSGNLLKRLAEAVPILILGRTSSK